MLSGFLTYISFLIFVVLYLIQISSSTLYSIEERSDNIGWRERGKKKKGRKEERKGRKEGRKEGREEGRTERGKWMGEARTEERKGIGMEWKRREWKGRKKEMEDKKKTALGNIYNGCKLNLLVGSVFNLDTLIFNKSLENKRFGNKTIEFTP